MRKKACGHKISIEFGADEAVIGWGLCLRNEIGFVMKISREKLFRSL
jgi:hypothetical protein